MARRTRRKDVLAALIILGASLVYWMNRASPGITFDDRASDSPAQPATPTDRVTALPGLRRDE